MAKDNPGGRPTVITDEVVRKLIYVFKLGFTVKKACEYVGITRTPFYDRINSDQDFANKMREAQFFPSLKARNSVIKSFRENPKLAMDWLERKERDEFSLRHELTGADGEAIQQQVTVVSEAKKRARKYDRRK